MRFYCGVKPTKFFLFLLILLASEISAQVIPDSIPTGVIKVQRPPVKPAYRVQMSMMYDDDRKRLTEISSKQIVFSDSSSGSAPGSAMPQPSLLYLRGVKGISDSMFLKENTEVSFPWEGYLNQIPFHFDWADSTRSDSMRFIYSIDKNGNAKSETLPWVREDSTELNFERAVYPYLIKLISWYPAKKVTKSRLHFAKSKRIACTVILTVYAYDPYAGRLLPIEVSGQ